MIQTPAHKQTDLNKKPGQVVYPVKSFNRYPWLPTPSFDLQAVKMSQAPTPLADYIERVLESEKGLPEPVTVDAKVLRHAIACLQQRGYPAVARELQKALDKS